MSDRSCVICTSEKAVGGVGCWSTLTDKSVGVGLLAPTSATGPGGGGIAWLKSVNSLGEARL